MKTIEEAKAEYNRVVLPLRAKYDKTRLGEDWDIYTKVSDEEAEKYNQVYWFWTASPTGQLCQVAQLLNEEQHR